MQCQEESRHTETLLLNAFFILLSCYSSLSILQVNTCEDAHGNAEFICTNVYTYINGMNYLLHLATFCGNVDISFIIIQWEFSDISMSVRLSPIPFKYLLCFLIFINNFNHLRLIKEIQTFSWIKPEAAREFFVCSGFVFLPLEFKFIL